MVNVTTLQKQFYDKMKENMHVKNFLVFIAFFMLIYSFFIGNVYAIGISPARVIIDFEPNLNKTFTYIVINNEGKELGVEMYASGDLAEYVTLHQTSATLAPYEKTKTFTFDLNLPSEIEKPGIHDTRIGAVEAIPVVKGKGAVVGARIAVEAQLWVKVPYPGKYAEISLDIPDVEVGETVDFSVSVSNLGDLNITAQDEIEVYDPTNVKVATLHTGKVDVETKATGELYAEWETKDVKPGRYKAVATVAYNGNSAKTEKIFRVGALLIEIVDVKIVSVVEGGIAKLEIEIESLWNEKISDIYAEIQIIDKGKTIAIIRSESVDLEPWKKRIIPVYWDTKGVGVGTYDGKVILHYDGKTAEKTAKIEIVTLLYTYILITGIVILILIIAGLIYYKKFRKRAKK